MKKGIISVAAVMLLSLMTVSIYAQNKMTYPVVDSKEYDQLKREDRLPELNPRDVVPAKVVHVSSNVQKDGSTPQITSSNNCECWVPTDATYTSAGQCDDCSFGPITLPFPFCFYGTPITTIYINNNGNISFVPYSTYTPNNFPTPLFSMVAPYWADVDTRGIGTGVMKYKITPTALYVNWESVGYYSMHADKLCTFQLIITDGNDPILPAGANVSFCYKDMDWTTGDASGGFGGFGGTPATNGANKGDGVNFVQFGRYDNPGSGYDGPFLTNDGVDWLDNKNFTFSICNSVGVNIPPVPAGISSCDTAVLCMGDTLTQNVLFLSPESGQTTTASAAITPATPGFSILNNTPGNFASITTQFIPNTPGYYTISYTGTDNGAPPIATTSSLVVHVDTMNGPTPIITGSKCAVPGGVTLSAGAGYTTYLWSTGNTTSSISGVGTGTYVVTVSSANGCKKTSAPFIVDPPMIVTANPTSNSCGSNNGTATATVTSGGTSPYTYVWSNNQTAQTATGLGAGNYFITVTDGNGCTQTQSVTVTNSNGPVTTMAQTNILCNGQCTGGATASVTGGSAPYTYSWSSGQSTSAANALCAGNYTLTVTDATGCTDVQLVNISQPSAFSTSVTSTQVGCNTNNGTATATTSGGTSPYTYNWNNGQTTSTATGLSAGTYSIAITDNNGCTFTGSVTVTQSAAITVSLSATQSSCGNNNGTATATVSGGTLSYTYVWNNGQTTSTATGLSAGNYSVTVTDANGCAQTQTIVVTNLGGPSTTMSQTNILCNGACTGTASAAVTGGNSPYTYFWSNSAVTPAVSNLCAGNYTLIVTDASGCTDIQSINITQPLTAIAVNPSSTPASCGANDGTATANASGGTGTLSYVWTPGGQNTSTATGLAGGTFYNVVVTDANGCTASSVVQVNNSSGPVITSSSFVDPLCNGGTNGSASVVVTGTGLMYSWTPSSQTSPTATGLGAGTYTVLVSDGSGCSATQIFTLNQPSAISASASANPTTCGNNNGSAAVIASGGTGSLSYQWTPTGQATANASGLSSGTYTVIVSDANGCTHSATANVAASSGTTVNAGADVLITTGDTASLNAASSTAVTYNWTPSSGLSCISCANPTASPVQTTQYCVTVTDANGCTARDCMILSVEFPCPENADIALPTAFTPNGDGHNDFYLIAGLNNCVVKYSLIIYNRWGEKVFETSDFSAAWDGKFHGKEMDAAVFVYYFSAVFTNGQSLIKKGNISLIR